MTAMASIGETLSAFVSEGYAGHPAYVIEDDGRLRVHVVLEVTQGIEVHPVIVPVWLPGPAGMEWVAGTDDVDFHRVMGRHYATWGDKAVKAVCPDVRDAVGLFAMDLLGLVDFDVPRHPYQRTPNLPGQSLSWCRAGEDPHQPRFLSVAEVACGRSLEPPSHVRPDAVEDVRQAAEARMRRLFAFDGRNVLHAVPEPTIVVSHAGNSQVTRTLGCAFFSSAATGPLSACFSLSEVDQADAFVEGLLRTRDVHVVEPWGVRTGRTPTKAACVAESVDNLAIILMKLSTKMVPPLPSEAARAVASMGTVANYPCARKRFDRAWRSPEEWRRLWDAVSMVLGPHAPSRHMTAFLGKDPQAFELVRTFLDLLTYGEVRNPAT